MDARHRGLEGPAARPFQREERHRIGRQAASDHAEGKAAAQGHENDGYHDYTSAALHSTAFAHYGYYEVKAKPMNSAGSSSFWFSTDYDGTQGKVTEIDVFEISGKSKRYEHKYNMSLHAWKDGPRLIAYVDPDPKANEHLEVEGIWNAPWRLADDYHVYGVDWEKDEIKFFVDGVVVRTVENTRWHYPLRLIFDSETMPDWFGMPEDKDLPSTFSIEYVGRGRKEKSQRLLAPRPPSRAGNSTSGKKKATRTSP